MVVDESQLVHLLVAAAGTVDVHEDLGGGPRVTAPLAAGAVPVHSQEAGALLLRESALHSPGSLWRCAAAVAVVVDVGSHQVVHTQ